ncbi:MAG: ABC transporter ATP-binding protein [Candidatus Promineifilaceae bacterium]|nr:ABC transporter ATP-binding protein [Candidatus Promineifilaceae bacterium]
MSDVAIRVEALSKRYRIGRREERPDTLREALMAVLKAPWQRLRRGGASSHREQDTIWALRDVSFEVKRGEVLGVIGRNGAGKSTLLKLLSQITEPTRGRAEIHGRVGSLLEVGTGFHQELTGRENVYLSGAVLGMTRSEIDEKFDEIVAFSGVEKFIDTPIKRYSSGMKVRLGFAVAAHLDPEILLVDEVLAVGDATFQKKCLGKMDSITNEGRTVLFVSHNMAMIKKLCSRAVLLDEGEVREIGPTDAVVERYLGGVHTAAGGSFGVRTSLLAERRDPKIYIEAIEIRRDGTDPKRGFRPQDQLRLQIRYNAVKPIRNPGFIVMLMSHDRVELCRVSNMPISGYYIDQIHGRGQIEVVFEQLPFVGGRYYITVGVAQSKVEWFLRLDDVAWFDVESTDPYGSGLQMDTRRGYMIIPHTWDHQPFSS